MIKNKIEESKLESLSLDDFMPQDKIVELCIDEFITEETFKEKNFRENLKNKDFSSYKNQNVFTQKSQEYIVPMWSYMLLQTHLYSHQAGEVYLGEKSSEMQLHLWKKNIENMDAEKYRDKKLLIAGCGKAAPYPSLYFMASKVLLPVVQSLMFGEACSSVPLYKKKIQKTTI